VLGARALARGGIRVEVHTFDVDGSVRDLPFNVIVAC
jgi:hypothetical protein